MYNVCDVYIHILTFWELDRSKKIIFLKINYFFNHKNLNKIKNNLLYVFLFSNNKRKKHK